MFELLAVMVILLLLVRFWQFWVGVAVLLLAVAAAVAMAGGAIFVLVGMEPAAADAASNNGQMVWVALMVALIGYGFYVEWFKK